MLFNLGNKAKQFIPPLPELARWTNHLSNQNTL